MLYLINLNKKQEKFLDMYLKLYPLRKEHKRRHYPGIVAKNFINSLIKREDEFKKLYDAKFGEESCQ